MRLIHINKEFIRGTCSNHSRRLPWLALPSLAILPINKERNLVGSIGVGALSELFYRVFPTDYFLSGTCDLREEEFPNIILVLQI